LKGRVAQAGEGVDHATQRVGHPLDVLAQPIGVLVQ
jgi:hypothetical protein